MMSSVGQDIPDELVKDHLDKLVNRFYKILPLKESGEPTLNSYIKSLQVEMIGCRDLISALSYDSMFLALLSILQYFSDNDCDVSVTRREVFKAISICKKLSEKYGCGEED